MTPRVTCVICHAWWYEGQSPKCQHTDAEWAVYQRRAFEPEDQPVNRAHRRRFGASIAGSKSLDAKGKAP